MSSTLDLPLLGLSKKERIVFSKVRDGMRTPLEIHESTRISRTAVYHILLILSARGLIHRYKEDGKRYVRIANEREMADILYEAKKGLLNFTEGKEEVSGVADSVVIVHRGVEALRACYDEMFSKNKDIRFTGVQGIKAYDHYKEKVGVETINKAKTPSVIILFFLIRAFAL